MLIKACLNGSRRAEDHEALPLSPTALAHDALDCQQAGAEAVHVHPRGTGGDETLQPDACAAGAQFASAFGQRPSRRFATSAQAYPSV